MSKNEKPEPGLKLFQNLRQFLSWPVGNQKLPGNPRLVVLEPRILYDASPLGVLLDHFSVQADILDPADPEFGIHLVNDLSVVGEKPVEVVFVDASVIDTDLLIRDFMASREASNRVTDFAIHYLDISSDGVDQVTRLLSSYSDLAAVHFFTHGDSATVQLGNTLLNSGSLAGYAADIASWGNSLAANADILFYGCNIAASPDGLQFIDSIHALTGADVAASDDLTGHADLGGDWDLEYAVGTIDVGLVVSASAQSSWYNVLDISSGLVLHNTFDANANDSSGNNYHGTLTNGALINTSSGTNKIGDGKVSLDGTNDYVDFSAHAASFDNLTEGTIAVWIYHDVNDRDVIFEMSDSGDADSRLALFRDTDGSFDFYVREGSTTLVDGRTAASVIPQNTWTHVAVTVDSSGNKLYVNGVQQSVTYSTGSASTNVFFDDVTQLDFGSWGVDKYSGSSFTRHFDGFLDDGRVYNRALSGSDITELYAFENTFTASFQQGVNGYTSTHDTEIRQASASTNYGNNAAIAVDLDNGGTNTVSQGLIRFDNLFGSGTGQIPYNVQIVSATLTVQTSDQTGGTISLHRMLTSWDESTATWNSLSGGLSANNIEMLSVTESQLTNPSTGTTVFSGLRSSVQAWADGNTNFGWGILNNSTDGWDFNSSEGTTKPILSIQYVMPGSQVSSAHTLVVDTATDNWDGDTSSIDALLASKGADGMISLREAIMAANATQNNGATPDQINFAIGSGTQTILVGAGGLPTITDAVNIDARTQPGYTSSPLITLNGSGATGATGGLVLRTNDSTISGFSVISFPDEGIEIDGSTGYGDNNTIQYNYVGLTASGTGGGNGDDGILVSENADNNVIRNNHVGSNGKDGIVIRNTDSHGNWVYGNTVGLAPDGATIRANGRHGVAVYNAGTNNLIGSNGDGSNDVLERNIISGNSTNGVWVSSSSGTIIRGNYIGTNSAGTLIRGNSSYGVEIDNSSSVIIDSNLISGNTLGGISLWNTGTTLATVTSNYIGTNAAGTAALGNTNDGIKIGGGANNNTIGGDRTLGKGNVISGNSGAGSDGIEISGTSGGTNNNKIYGNYIGTNATGTAAIGNARYGVVIYNGAQGTEIGGTGTGQGNIISGNTSYGIIVDGNNGTTTTGTVIVSNLIGLNMAGTAAIANGAGGITLIAGARSTTIGGNTAAQRNFISGNNGPGINISGATTQTITVAGNYIGLGTNGTTIVANTGHGVSINNSAFNNTIGGLTSASRNVISGNDGFGVYIASSSTGNLVLSNYIGTDATGTSAKANLDGIWIEGANNTIGQSGSGNLISGNTYYGVTLDGATATGNTIRVNLIGTNAAGTGAIANGAHGVYVINGANTNAIGGTVAGDGNTIAYNLGDGIFASSTAGVSNSFLRNLIHGNSDLGIDLGTDGMTANDPSVNMDSDTGPNDLQNFPVITSAVTNGTQITINGTINSLANSFFRIEFFASISNDGSGHGEGQRYLGFANVGTDGSGNGTINAVLTAAVSAGEFISATATKSNAGYTAFTDTSEFALSFTATSPNTPPVTAASGGTTAYTENAGPTVVDSGLTITDSDSADFNGGSLTFTISANASANDRLLVVPGGAVTVLGNGVYYSGTLVGTTSGGKGTSPLVITFNASSTPAIAQAIGRQVAFFNASDNPSTAVRTIQFVVNDGDSGVSNTSQKLLSVTAVADAPIAVNDRTSLTFDGIDDYVNIGSNPSLEITGTSLTMEAWINPAAYDATNGSIVLNREGEYEIGLSGTGTLRWALANSNPGWNWIDTGYVIPLNEWSHIAVSNNNGVTSTFVNGTLVDINYGAGAITDAHLALDDFRIGGRQNSPTSQYFIGQIDDVRIWNIARSEAQIRSNLNQVLAPQAGLIGYWQLNEASGTTTADSAGTNPGTLVDGGAGTTGPQWTRYATDQNTQINIAAASGVLSNDIDGEYNPLTITQVNGSGVNVGSMFVLPSGAQLTVNSTGSFTYNPNGVFNYLTTGQSATDTFTYQVSDGNGGFDTATATIFISGTNDAPQATNLSAAESYTEEIALNLTDIVVTDADHANVTVTLTLSDLSVGTLSTGTSGAVTSTFSGGVWTASGAKADVNALLAGVVFTPTADFNGNFTISTSVSDGEAAPVTGIKIFTGTPVNDAPIRTAGSVNNLTVNEDSGFTSLGFGSLAYGPGGGVDESGQTITYNVTAVPTGLGSVYLADGTTLVTTSSVLTLTELRGLQFRTTTNSTGTSGFQFNPTDSGGTANGGSDNFSEFILITVNQVNDAPTLTASALNPTFTEAAGLGTQATAVNVFGSAVVSTVESGQTITGLTFTITGLLNGANEVIVVDGRTITLGANSSGTTATNGLAYSSTVSGGTATIVLSGGSLTTAATQTLVNGITYQNTNTDNPAAGNRVVTLTEIKDNGGVANGGQDTTTLSIASTVTVTAVNDQAVFTSLDGTPTFTEGGPAVVLDSNVTVVDAELSAANDFSGATLTLARNGGASAQDVYSATGTLSALTQGGSLVVGGITAGTVTTNSAGTLVLTFNANATNALVNSVMQQIAYSNSSDAPPNSAQIDWTFNDGNTGSQGSGGAMLATGSTTVTIIAVNDEQVLSTNAGTTVLEGSSGNVITTAMLQTTDVDNTAAQLVYTITSVPTNGVIRRSGIDLSVSSTFTQADIDAGTITYLHNDTETISDSFSFTVDDGVGITSSGTFNITVTLVNDNSVTAVSDNNAAADFVLENVSVGTSVGITAFATDGDVTDTVSYSLDDNAGGLFAIDSVTGVVSVAGAIDRETAASYNITVRATSTDTSTTTRVFAIAIGDVDEFNVTVPTDTDPAANEVDENVIIGTAVGLTANAFDLDATNNTITYSLTSNPDGLFQIDAVTGVVTTAAGIDRETHGASRNITVQASSSDGSTALQSFTITINDLNEFAVSTPTDSNAAANEVNENVAIGTTVGVTANALDLDATNNTITYSLTSNPDGLFQVDTNTGVVTTAAAIDREVHGASRSITVQAASSDGSTATQNFTITINDLNEFGVSTPTDSNATANAVNENVAIGTTVGLTANAFDLDATNNTITYSLTSNPDGLFQIDVNTGVVTTAAAIDRETHGASRNITVQASSSDGSTASQSFNITINDLNEFGVSIPTDSNAAANAVNENVAIGTTVGLTANAFDLDATNNTIAYSLASNPDGLFQIDVNTGVVTTAAGIDRETHGASRNITVQAASSDGSTATQNFTITINDLNEFGVSTPTDSNAAANAVNENVAIGTTVGLTANAFDLDATNNTITYSLTSNPDGLFQIDVNTGLVTTAAAIDRETHGASRSITVQAASSDGSTATQNFTITINDLNEFGVSTPTDSNVAANAVNENVAIGTTVGLTANAFDLDATNNTITYSLTSNPDGLFQIDVNTGIVTTAAAVDREVHGSSRSITVQAASSDGSTATQNFTITINDLNEFGVSTPTDSNAAANAVNENVAIGTTVGLTANAFDLDATNNTITYSLTSNPDGLFQIDVNTGIVTTAAAVDREVHGSSRSITVQAASSDGSTASQSFIIAINDLDEFDVGVVSDTNAAANSVAENAMIGTVVGITAFAQDVDATNNTITYTLDDNAGGLFAIDGVTGVVTVAGALDYETATSHNITVRASSSDSSSSTQLFTINVTDVNESGITAISDTDAAADFVLENVTVGTVVGLTAFADDLDATDTVSYSLDDDAGGLFSIDSTSGVVTVAGAIDRESAANYNITVRATSTDASTTTRVFTVAIGDVDEFDVSTPTDSNVAANAVNENVAIGTTVGLTANAFDLDATNNTITYSLTSNPDGLFQIDVNTGVVTTAAGIDRETHGASRNVTVQAASSDGSTATQNFTITINDLNEFGVSTPTDSNAAANAVNENVAIGTTVGLTANAFDLDATNNTITYSLTSNPDGLFQIDVNTGIVTTAAAIDREVHGASRSITVQAASSDGSTASQSFNITINDLDEFDVSTPTDSNAAANTVNENVAIGTTVGLTANAFDLDATNNTITYSLTSNPDGLFQIDVNTGIVTTALAIDRETHGASRNITVQATSSDGSTASQSFNITINDLNEFGVSTPTDSNAAANAVNENVAIGTTVGLTANAFDLDATNNTITYSLTSNPDGLFQIDVNTGVVTTAAAIDRETHGAVRSITVQAASSDGSTASQSFNITINDLDEYDVGAVSDTNASANSVAEDATTGTAVGITAFAEDLDATNNTITYTLDDDAGGLFAIDGVTGVVTVAGSLDYETATSHNITVRASSTDGSSSTQSFLINVTDVNESGVTAISDTDAAADFVMENVSVGTVVGVTAFADDADGTDTVSYSLDDDAGGLFSIDSTTGVVTVAGAIDRETAASYNITVRATSTDISTTTRVFTIAIGDVDEFDVSTPTDSDGTTNAVDENVAIGTTIGLTANAFDLDATNNTITYSLTSNPDGLFQIDINTGVVTTASALNREVHGATRSITVQAASSDGSTASQSFNITINDVDEYDVTVPTDADAAINEVNENVATGTTVGLTANAFDLDATNNTITYSLTSNPDGLFQIDANTGVVTTAVAIDREMHGSVRSITVQAQSSDGSTASQSFNITINDLDEFDVGAVSDTNAAANSVAENATMGTVVGITAFAEDLDATNNTVTYSLDDDAGGRFVIDGITGVVTTAGTFDYETATSHNITVRATSTDGSSSTQLFTINVTDVNEFAVTAPVDSNPSTNSVDENSGTGAATGLTAYASDGDGSNNLVTYSLDDDAGGRFQIDSATGIVTVLDGTLLDRELAASHDITVRATSSDGSSATQVFTININDVDEFDVGAVTDIDGTVNSVNENAATGTAVGITASASDADATNNAITYSLFDDDGGRFQIDSNTGVVTVLGAIDRETDGPIRSITVRATSQDGSFTDQSFTIGINDVNEYSVSPIVDGDGSIDAVDENAVAGTVVGITAQATDGDATNNIVGWSLSDDAGGRFAIDPVTGQITTTGPLDHEAAASHSVTVRAVSADGSVSFRTFAIGVNDLNEVPSGADSAVSTPEDTLLTLNIAIFGFSDPDAGDFLVGVRIDTLPAAGQLNLNGSAVFPGQIVSAADIAAGRLTWMPPANAFGTGMATIGFTVADSGGLFATGGNTLNLDVSSVNDNPTANGTTYSINEDNGLSGNATGSDIDSPSSGWSYQLLTAPANASSFVLNSNGSFTYQPSQDFNGIDSFVFRMHDGQGGTSDATVTINVVPVNDAPMSISDVFAVFQGDTLIETLGVLANDFDVENDPLIAVLLTSPSSGTLTFNTDGTFQYTPAIGFVGSVQFSYLASDGQVNGSPVQVTINVDAGSGGPTGGGGGGTGGGGGIGDTGDGGGGGGSGDDDNNDDSLLIGPGDLKALLARLARNGDGADTIDAQPGNSSPIVSSVMRSVSNELVKSEFSELNLIEQLATALEKRDRGDGLLEIELRTGGPKLVFSMDGIWESLVGAEKNGHESNGLFSVSPLAMGTGAVTFAAAVTYLLWYLRGGVLMATFLSQIPTWRMIDPLPILESSRENKREVKDDMQSFFG